jgi:hypothetical protein
MNALGIAAEILTDFLIRKIEADSPPTFFGGNAFIKISIYHRVEFARVVH